MRDFDYVAARSVAEAVRVLQEHDGRARPLAGGTDLIDQIRVGRHTPDVLVDIKRIPELNILEAGPTGLRLGAAVPCYRIASSAAIQTEYAALADSARIIGGVQIQSRGSFGGNVCNSGPAADSTPSLIALGARCVVAGPSGQREVPVEQFCTGPGKNVLGRGEFLVEFVLPKPSAHSGSRYVRFIPRNEMDIAVVGVGVAVTLNPSGEKFAAVRVALGAVGPTPILVGDMAQLVGQPVGDAAFDKAASLAKSAAKPIDDMRGTKEFRTHLAGVLTRRALEAAVARARGLEPAGCHT